MEIDSSALVFNKTEVMRWLANDDQSVRIGSSFKASVALMQKKSLKSKLCLIIILYSGFNTIKRWR